MTIQEFLTKFFDKFQGFGNFASVTLTIFAFWGALSKRPRRKIKDFLLTITKEANQEIKTNIEEINDKIKKADATDLALLRNAITNIYFKYLDTKKIPHYEKENMLYLAEQYEKLGGNSYVKNVVKEMSDWEEII